MQYIERVVLRKVEIKGHAVFGGSRKFPDVYISKVWCKGTLKIYVVFGLTQVSFVPFVFWIWHIVSTSQYLILLVASAHLKTKQTNKKTKDWHQALLCWNISTDVSRWVIESSVSKEEKLEVAAFWGAPPGGGHFSRNGQHVMKALSLPGTILDVTHSLNHLIVIMISWDSYSYYSYFANEKIEEQRD